MKAGWILTIDELEAAEGEAMDRFARGNIVGKRGGQDQVSAETALAECVLGCEAELALSLALGLPWTGRGPEGRYHLDVGDRFEARGRAQAWHDLPIQERDLEKHPDVPFVLLLRLERAVFRFGGWALPVDVAKPENWRVYRAGGGAWYAPRGIMRPMAELPL